MKVFEELLNNYWILKSENEELYYEIKDNEYKISDFLKTRLGYKLIVTSLLIKLEKLPGKPTSIFGISGFEAKEEYVLLCLVLMYLETKSINEQFILSQLIDYIKSNILNLESNDIVIDFTRYAHRKMMVKVLKFIDSMHFIRKYDGNENNFLDSEESDVLYEVTGISKFFMRNFTENISQYSSYEDIFKGDNLGLEQDRGDERVHRIYRRIFTEPIIYQQNKDDLDYLYIKNYRFTIEKDVEEYLDSSFFVNKNGAYIVLREDKNFKEVFPNTKAISDVILFTCTNLLESIKQEKTNINVDGTLDISKIELHRIILNAKDKYGSGFSVEYKTMENEKYIETIIEYLKSMYMVENDENSMYKIMPLMFRLCGKYPNDFEKGGE